MNLLLIGVISRGSLIISLVEKLLARSLERGSTAVFDLLAGRIVYISLHFFELISPCKISLHMLLDLLILEDLLSKL